MPVVFDGEVIRFETEAGGAYIVVPQATITFDVPSETVRPGDEVPVSVSVGATGESPVSATEVAISVPDGWCWSMTAWVKTLNVEDAPGKAEISGAENLLKGM